MPSEISSFRLYRRLLAYVRPYRLGFVVAMLTMGLSAVVEPAFPALMKFLLDDGFTQTRDAWDWLLYPICILGIFLARAILGFVGDYAMAWVSNNVILDLREEMFARLLRLPTGYFGDNLSGRLMSRIANDVTYVAGSASTAISSFVKDSLSIVGLVAWLFYLNWKLTLVTIAMVPFISLAVRTFSRRLRRIARGQQETQGQLTQVLQEAIEGHKVVKIFGGQSYEAARFGEAVRQQRGFNMRSTVATALQGPIVQFFAALALSIIMAVALYQAAKGQTTVGSFVSFITAMLMLLAPLKRLTDLSAPIQRGLAASESVFALIDEPGESDDGTIDLKRAQGHVAFEDVSFTYPGAERAALQNLDFVIKPGECVALVGPSGCGKTTSANLLPRLFHLNSGTIRIDGHRLEEIRLDSLRANIALVSQEVVLFNDSVAANIAYGTARAAKREDIVAAARAAHALEFIEALPQGFDTLIGEHGVKLSGGQRQRLAIARALLKDAPILILDEATSALDTESERQVQAALDALMRGRATLVIAHRLSTIERADRIITLSQGRKMEEGTHAELAAHNGLYARLCRLQKMAEENSAPPAH